MGAPRIPRFVVGAAVSILVCSIRHIEMNFDDEMVMPTRLYAFVWSLVCWRASLVLCPPRCVGHPRLRCGPRCSPRPRGGQPRKAKTNAKGARQGGGRASRLQHDSGNRAHDHRWPGCPCAPVPALASSASSASCLSPLARVELLWASDWRNSQPHATDTRDDRMSGLFRSEDVAYVSITMPGECARRE